MKILFLIRSLHIGGAERQLVTLAQGLAGRGHDVAVAVFYAGGELDVELHPVPLIDLGKQGRWDVLPFLARLVRCLRGRRPDVLHSFLGTANILSVLLKPFFPGVSMVWGLRASDMDLAQYDWLARVSFGLERRLSRFADRIAVNSEAGLAYALSQGFPSDRMSVVQNGIDTERFRPDPEAGQRVRREWGVAEGEVLIGLVGRVDPMKDHPTFFRAAALLCAKRPGLRFVCVGDGPAERRRDLETLARDLGLSGRVLLAGVRADMPAVYNALDLLCSSSRSEGFSNAIAESMACGTPCVATNVGDSARIVGEAGATVPPGAPGALAGAVEALLDRLALERQSLGSQARERVVRNFSLAAMVAHSEAMLAAVAAK